MERSPSTSGPPTFEISMNLSSEVALSYSVHSWSNVALPVPSHPHPNDRWSNERINQEGKTP
uniref:Uncharacterized protein n=1 Tax=Arundo donax TaxID=35708 RepID=A0A0A9GJP1_ARUDO